MTSLPSQNPLEVFKEGVGGRKTRLVIGCPGAAEAGGPEAGTGGAGSTARP